VLEVAAGPGTAPRAAAKAGAMRGRRGCHGLVDRASGSSWWGSSRRGWRGTVRCVIRPRTSGGSGSGRSGGDRSHVFSV
jgi:hypothetical protein